MRTIVWALSMLVAAPLAASDAPWVRSPTMPVYVAVDVRDVDAAVAWYSTVFDVATSDDTTAPDGRYRIANLRGADVAIELIRDRRSTAVAEGARHHGLAKVGVTVPDVRVVADRVEAAGHERPRVVEFERHGIRLIQLHDPEGNTIQLHSPLEPTPEADDRQVLLDMHREVLRAHRDNDLDAWLADESEAYVMANRGEISHPSIEERRARLQPYLAATTFTAYDDLVEPIVRVSADGTLGWVVCQVRTAGTTDGTEFDSVWAWIELYEKRDGRWLRVGNVSNRRPS